MSEKKLKIIGPYTPDHPGPFCTRDGVPVDLRIRDGRGLYPLVGYIGLNESMDGWLVSGEYQDCQEGEDPYDLMNAEEVPVAREFWVNEYEGVGTTLSLFHDTLEEATKAREGYTRHNFLRTIHVREVTPGDGE